jgi:hypothetical protein
MVRMCALSSSTKLPQARTAENDGRFDLVALGLCTKGLNLQRVTIWGERMEAGDRDRSQRQELQELQELQGSGAAEWMNGRMCVLSSSNSTGKDQKIGRFDLVAPASCDDQVSLPELLRVTIWGEGWRQET